MACLELLPAEAAAPRRIVSINACADQLLLALADRQQILALTHYARDPNMSFYADRAQGLPTIRGDAEQVLKDRKSTRLNSSHVKISYAVFCLKKKKKRITTN